MLENNNLVSKRSLEEGAIRSYKKIIGLVILLVLICAGIGVGLGFGLKKQADVNNSYNEDIVEVESDIWANDEEVVENVGWTTTTTTTTTTKAPPPGKENDGNEDEEKVMVDTVDQLPDDLIYHAEIVGEEEEVVLNKTDEDIVQRPQPEDVVIYDAVIVGAGWAGIRAAQTLLDAGITNILVLEANNYIGGRVKSINSDNSINSPTAYNDVSNVPLDYGGEWLYSYNAMENFMLSNGYLDVIEENLYDNFDAYLDSYNAQFYLQSNEGDSARLLSNEEANELRVNIWDEYLDFREDELQRDDSQSVYSAAEKFKQQKSMTNTELQYFNLMMDLGEVDYAADISQLDLKYYRWQHHTMCDMTYMSYSGTGFGNLAATVAESFIDKVRLSAKVTEINYEDVDNTIISYTQNGVDKKVAAKTVLVTVSLGVLKANTINFVPTLPDWKLEVIEKTGFGAMNKIMMQWNDNDAMVWPYEQTWFELITPGDESSGRWTTFFNPTQFKRGVPTLVGWVGGDEAWEMEEQTDEQVLDDAMANLKTMFPTISKPDRVVVTRWGKEENILGTYSYKVVGRDWNDDSNELGRKVGSIWFAGEATARAWSGTTFGSFRSGEESAKEMIEEITSS